MAELYYTPFNPLFTSNGLPAPGARLNFYVSGTSTRSPVYTDEELTVQHPNPVVADAAGRFPAIYLDEAITYRVVPTNALGVALGAEVDPYLPGEMGQGPRGFNGINGGVGSSAGFAALFAAANGMAIGAGITRIRTSGYAVAGIGAADYVYDTVVNAAFVTANPRVAFVAADGRGFHIAKAVIEPEMLGAVLDADIEFGGGTDDTAAVNAALRLADTWGNVHVRFRGVARVTGIEISSNTFLEFLPGGDLYHTDNAGRTLVRNKNQLRGQYQDTEQQQYDRIIDHDIKIIGGTFNGNQASHPNIRGADNSLVNIMSFYGVRDLVVHPDRMINPGCYFIHLALCERFDVGGFSIDLPNQGNGLGTGPTNYNGDGVHLNGPCRDGKIHDMRGRSADDFIALTADDGPETGPTGMFAGNWIGPNVGQGPIRSITLERLKMDKALYGVRILSKFSRCDDIVIRDISGTVYGRAINIDAYKEAGGPWNGDVGKVLVENMKVQALRYTGGAAATVEVPNPTRAVENRLMNIGCKAEEIIFRNCTKLACPLPEFTHYPWLDIDPNSVIDYLEIDGLRIYNRGTEDMRGAGLIRNAGGLIRTLQISKVDWQRDPTVPATGSLLDSTGGAIGVLRARAIRANRTTNLIKLRNGGEFSVFQASDIYSYEAAAGTGILFLETSLTKPVTTMRGCNGSPAIVGPSGLETPVANMDDEWITFNGVTLAITGKSDSIFGVERVGVGLYRIQFVVPIALAGIYAEGYGNGATPSPYPATGTFATANSCDVQTYTTAYVAADAPIVSVVLRRGKSA